MKRLYLMAVLGFCPGVARAQEGLAPTAPVVPAPVLQNGRVLTPTGGGGWGAGEPRTFSVAKWSPFRNPATASAVEPTAAYAPQPAPQYAPQLPPLPTGVSVPDANCGPAGCGHGGRDRSCWEKVKALLCFHYSPSELPKLRPTPYVTSLTGMFPCAPVGGAGCTSGCATPVPQAPVYPASAYQGAAMPAYGQPAPQLGAPAVGRAPQPGPTAGAVAMPARGAPSPVQPTWQGRVTPESAAVAKPAAPGAAIVPTGYKYPAPK